MEKAIGWIKQKVCKSYPALDFFIFEVLSRMKIWKSSTFVDSRKICIDNNFNDNMTWATFGFFFAKNSYNDFE